MGNEKPGEPILIFPRHALFPLKFHYSGLNILVPIPGKGNPSGLDETPDALYDVINNESEIVESLPAISKSPTVLWVVRYPANEYLGVKYNSELFDQFIDKNYNIKSSKSFFKDTKVMLIEKKRKPPDT